MIRGVTFIVSFDTQILMKVLCGINVTEYLWINDLDQNEVWSNTKGGEALAEHFYKGTDFYEEIHHEHYILFIKLQAYSDSIDLTKIKTYDDFCKSKCQILILIADNKYVNIYVKDPKVCGIFYDNALKNGFANVGYISENNDRRVTMDIM